MPPVCVVVVAAEVEVAVVVVPGVVVNLFVLLICLSWEETVRITIRLPQE